MTREEFINHVEGTQESFRRFLVALCCGDSSLADDIAQEAYIKAYLSLGSFRKIGKFDAWIYRIGYNTFLNHRRAEKKSMGYEEAEKLAGGDVPDSSFRYEALYEALDQLSPAERTCILLFYLEGYSIKEIASIVQASQDAVKQHLYRGRKHLKDLLQE